MKSSSSLSSSVLPIIICFTFVTLVRILIGYQPHSGQDNYQGPITTTTTSSTASSTNTNNNNIVKPYGGDYEAQRHWMEITINLPISQWYYYDIYYWGIDYPPLTTYHSYIFGYIGQYIIPIDDIQNGFILNKSRGYENPIHKSYMRSTVILSDILCYGTIIWILVMTSIRSLSSLSSSSSSSNIMKYPSFLYYYPFIYCMIQPSIILIDHGHFQYNTVALGLALYCIYYITKQPNTITLHNNNCNYEYMYNCMIGSIFFVGALSFKQMTLYYAPPIFFYLLGRCFASSNITKASTINNDKENASNTKETTHATTTVSSSTTTTSYTTILYRISLLGITVIITFALLWFPFILYGPTNDTKSYINRLLYILQRIIPIQRGLFEGKVSNVWCVLSMKPIRIRQRIPTSIQPIIALIITMILIIPSSIHIFYVGMYSNNNHNHNNNQKNKNIILKNSRNYIYDRQQLLWCTYNSALAFFLTSFQVHEKSLLLALTPCSVLFINYYYYDKQYQQSHTTTSSSNNSNSAIMISFIHWFTIVTVWTLWPLLQIDRLQVGYVCMIIIYISIVQLQNEFNKIIVSSSLSSTTSMDVSDTINTDPNRITSTTSLLQTNDNFFTYFMNHYFHWISSSSYIIMIGLHIIEWMTPIPPKNLPDIFPVLWSIFGCLFCCIAYIISFCYIFVSHTTTYNDTKTTSSSINLVSATTTIDQQQKKVL